MTGFNGSTARSPWYGAARRTIRRLIGRLQWVHGSLAVVWEGYLHVTPETVKASMGPRLARRGMVRGKVGFHGQPTASMGPRLARRGMGDSPTVCVAASTSFNGSTARSPWYGEGDAPASFVWSKLQWVHGSLAVVWSTARNAQGKGRVRFNGSTARSPWYGRRS